MASKASEIAWGTSQEERIAARWVELSEFADGAACCLKTGRFADVDFVLLTGEGLPLVWLEIKARKKPFAAFGDALFPLRKHQFAKELLADFNLPFIGVAEYSCGTLAEVNLATAPTRHWSDFKRHDRRRSVPHIVYGKDKLTILAESR